MNREHVVRDADLGLDRGAHLRSGFVDRLPRCPGLRQHRFAGRQHDGFNPAGLCLDHDGVADPGRHERVLDVLRVDVEPVRQDDDVLLAAHEDQMAALVVAADVTGSVPAVLGQ